MAKEEVDGEKVIVYVLQVCVCVCVTPCTKGFNATVSTTTTP